MKEGSIYSAPQKAAILLQELVAAIADNRSHPLLQGWEPRRMSLREEEACEILFTGVCRLEELGLSTRDAEQLGAIAANKSGAWRTFPKCRSRQRYNEIGPEVIREWRKERSGNTPEMAETQRWLAKHADVFDHQTKDPAQVVVLLIFMLRQIALTGPATDVFDE